MRLPALAISAFLLSGCSAWQIASSSLGTVDWALGGFKTDMKMPKNAPGANCEFPNSYADRKPNREACEKAGGKWTSR